MDSSATSKHAGPKTIYISFQAIQTYHMLDNTHFKSNHINARINV